MGEKSRAELLAIPLVAATAAYTALVYWAAAAQTSWAWLLLGLATAAFAVLLGLVCARRHKHPSASEAPVQAGSVRDDGIPSPAFRAQLLKEAGGRLTEAFVAAPALPSRLARWTGDLTAYEDATTRLNETVEPFAATGVDAQGHIGAHDPLQAADDGLRKFQADAIVFATHPEGRANWLEEGVVETARNRCSVPVTPVVVDAAD
jgi:hypothetical protein